MASIPTNLINKSFIVLMVCLLIMLCFSYRLWNHWQACQAERVHTSSTFFLSRIGQTLQYSRNTSPVVIMSIHNLVLIDLLPECVCWFSVPQKHPRHLDFYVTELFLLIQHLSHHPQLLPQKHSDLCSRKAGWVEFDHRCQGSLFAKSPLQVSEGQAEHCHIPLESYTLFIFICKEKLF